MEKSKVYIKFDARTPPCVTACEGGCTEPPDLTGWTYVDEGIGDRYALCQSNYFDGGLYTMDGICRYKYVDGVCSLRTGAEMQADRDAAPQGKTLEEVAAYLNETAKVVMLMSVE